MLRNCRYRYRGQRRRHRIVPVPADKMLRSFRSHRPRCPSNPGHIPRNVLRLRWCLRSFHCIGLGPRDIPAGIVLQGIPGEGCIRFRRLHSSWDRPVGLDTHRCTPSVPEDSQVGSYRSHIRSQEHTCYCKDRSEWCCLKCRRNSRYNY